MQWLSDALPGIFGPSQDAAKNLQATDMLTKDQLLQFFESGEAMFADPGVKARLRDTHSMGKDVNDAIEELQKAIFERQGVKGDWGIKCLAVVNTTFKTDADFLSRFYSFVSKEEEAVDEAEMPAEEFQRKQAFKAQLLEQNRQRQTALNSLSPEERERVVQAEQNQRAALEARLQSMPEGERADFMAAQVMAAQAAVADAAGARSVMTQSEQMRFFQSLHASDGGGVSGEPA